MRALEARRRIGAPITLRNISTEKSASDTRQCQSALKFFHNFLQHSYGPSELKSDQLYNEDGHILEELVTGSMLGFFCGFCLDQMSTWSTAKNYYSQIKKYLGELYPNKRDVIQFTSNKMQKKITSHFRKKCAANRTNLISHHLPFTPEDNHYMCQFLFKNDNHEACLLQAIDFHNGGRITEGRALQWDDLCAKIHADRGILINCLLLRWFHDKTAALSEAQNIGKNVSFMA